MIFSHGRDLPLVAAGTANLHGGMGPAQRIDPAVAGRPSILESNLQAAFAARHRLLAAKRELAAAMAAYDRAHEAYESAAARLRPTLSQLAPLRRV